MKETIITIFILFCCLSSHTQNITLSQIENLLQGDWALDSAINKRIEIISFGVYKSDTIQATLSKDRTKFKIIHKDVLQYRHSKQDTTTGYSLIELVSSPNQHGDILHQTSSTVYSIASISKRQLKLYSNGSPRLISYSKCEIMPNPPTFCPAPPLPKDSIIYDIGNVQVKPIFTGDVEKYIKNNLKYPDSALKKNIEGTEYLSFVIEKSGAISNIRILRSSNKIFDYEATRVISLMPKWTPGRQNGELVRVSNVIRVTFKP